MFYYDVQKAITIEFSQ